ncbi:MULTISPECIES: preprotein translocase subunit SecA [Nitrosomonas]|uniref:Protein translocase subunit SecA n=2 Tax=Nitrosomonas eutropha TaxID=916 RepID=SECA_NITEC|nr:MULTISPECIES: preprotein translocase subunit SecA [Nitrosomonas]Q0AH18.1 RecName: Full=Protein translocase subunit SecA [Nitrosomonas eutropha C91]ABI59364.1 protein translocase subunit secA [Nitrosomonas eutropha C91]MXS81355.1 preprotein translocase subunit SecA [Nitrosomonas sp. GH22]PXV79773.1 protein translocase subunit secA [Nitrosomonas eutropha]SCX25571.1 protein translocase subunit secA [Nitrosomonas eutropha]SDW86748.1 protein translocase subunit secA [Nitrosomonas eutropha]
MLSNLLKGIFGSRNDRLVKQYSRIVRTINELEAVISPLSDEELRDKTSEFKQRISNGEKLDQLLPEAFAVVREASKRVLGMRHFDVQLIGGMVLHEGKIAEMRTGEGKTLMATLPIYLNALSGKGVHIVTVNDYLAKRDAEWMGQIYQFLGLSVGVVLSQMPHEDKQAAYGADITYGTNNEYGFDYLRDNMVGHSAERVQRVLNFAIVDEVDSILIDEARTPLIISGMAEGDTEVYKRVDVLIPRLTRQKDENSPGDYSVDEKTQQVLLSEEGFIHAEKLLGEVGLLPAESSLYDPANITLIHHLNAGLRAHALYNRDQHYVVQNDEVVIVDEFTGRLMPGRRWSEGLHQAVEAKENVSIQKENQTLASITFQNYFRMYEKLAGMTGTADTEAFEFQQIYGLETVVIPTHRPIAREDRMDQVFRTAREKYQAIIADIKSCYERGQPVLVGTGSIENNELLSTMLTKEKLPHQVLNAKQHEREADIIAQAGQSKMVTIATNMAGRGTDIVLGGNLEQVINRIRVDDALDDMTKTEKIKETRQAWQVRHDEVIKLGGLHIIGTERHESRRIDNQLRGRSGRQGDPGSSRFYLSLEDPLLRIFSSDRVANIMTRLKMPEGEAIEHPWVTRAIENAQRKVEARNFDIRKQLLEYDDVANDQRKVIYQQRNELLDAEQGISETVSAIRESVINQLIGLYIPAQSIEEQWDVPGLEKALASEFLLRIPVQEWLEADSELHEENLRSRIMESVNTSYQGKVEQVGASIMNQYERMVMLHSIDSHWREHLAALDHLRQGIHLRGYAQQNPKQEYKREAFELFAGMLDAIKADVTKILMTVQIRSEQQVESVAETSTPKNLQYHHAAYSEAEEEHQSVTEGHEAKQQPFVRKSDKIGRNDPCPCGSGRKYKQCHGKLD